MRTDITIRIASFNVKNLFARPKVFDLSDWNAGEPVLKAYEKVSALLQKPKYSTTDNESVIFSLRWRYIQSTKKQKQFAATTHQILSGRGLERIAVRLTASRAINARMWRS